MVGELFLRSALEIYRTRNQLEPRFSVHGPFADWTMAPRNSDSRGAAVNNDTVIPIHELLIALERRACDHKGRVIEWTGYSLLLQVAARGADFTYRLNHEPMLRWQVESCLIRAAGPLTFTDAVHRISNYGDREAMRRIVLALVSVADALGGRPG